MTTTSAAKLLDCPFCGMRPVEDRIAWSVECFNCEFRIFDYGSHEKAVTKWNRRALPDADGWVSVKDRLPPKSDDYMDINEVDCVFTHGNRPRVLRGYYVHELHQWRMSGSPSDFSEYVTHWRPLPKPPETRG